MKTITQQLLIKKFPFEIRVDGNLVYFENSNGFWFKREFDLDNNEIYYENSEGYWYKREFDLDNNEIYYENSDDFWFKQEFDLDNNKIYYENSKGTIIDNRPKQIELTLDEIAEKFGVDVNNLKIKK